MAEIRDKIRRDIWVLVYEHCERKDIPSIPIEDQILSIPELAIVDRGAKLPEIPWPLGEPLDNLLRKGYKIAQQDMLKKGFVREVKSETRNNNR